MARTNDTNRLNTTDIDFNDISKNLKEYLRSQDKFKDYDFEGSAISSIIDLLSYVTHYNALNANMGLNEAFLDTAQFRGSVVGHAATLGYVPSSAKASVAYVDIQLNNPNTETIEIPRGSRFRSTKDNIQYTFVTDQRYTSIDGTFESVKLVQGDYKTVSYIYDSQSNEKYLVPSPDVDIELLNVKVYDSRDSETYAVFKKGKDLTEIFSDSNVYFLTENPEGLYEVRFGDGVLGRQLQNGNFIEIEYIVTQKDEVNGTRLFSIVDPIAGTKNADITVEKPSRGGAERESIDQIKARAPLSYSAQNRAVVPNDYKSIIQENFSNVRSVKVWGGEDNTPPEYGKVFISVLPKDGKIFGEGEKQSLMDNVIRPKSMVTIRPELIDPEFLMVSTETFFKYDPSLTNSTLTELELAVENSIKEFNDQELNSFNNIFRYSRYLNAIDQTDDSILNSFARVYLSKVFRPFLNVKTTYELDFSTYLEKPSDPTPVIYSSSTFTINSKTDCRFKDFLDTNGKRKVSIVRGTGNQETVVINKAGVIEGTKIILNGFAPQVVDSEVITITVIPESYDVVSTLNNVISIDTEKSIRNIHGEVDTIVSGRDYSGINYRTFNRDA